MRGATSRVIIKVAAISLIAALREPNRNLTDVVPDVTVSTVHCDVVCAQRDEVIELSERDRSDDV